LGSGQNLFLQSNTFTTTWVQSSATPTTTVATTDPFGGTSAWLLTEDNTTNPHRVFQTITTVNQPYTISCYFKSNTRTWSYLRAVNSAGTALNAWFNLSTGVVGITDSGLTSAIQSVGNGWYRCSIYIASTLAGANATSVGMSTGDGIFSYAGNGTSSLYIYGAQFELGTTANTYIPTTTTAIYGTPTLTFSGVAGMGLQSDGSLYVSPAGTGALQAQATTSTTAGGNARGANAVDWQTIRSAATKVSSGPYTVVGGGYDNISNGFGSGISTGYSNTSNGAYSIVAGGRGNTAGGNDNAVVVGGYTNTAAGFFNFIGGGFTNNGTSTSAVTTQSATMNGTTAVTLAATNANIKVGQVIIGTSIANYTYVAAISGTSLTLSQAASGSSTSTLSFYTPHGIVVGGGNNQATGSYSFIGGGGDAGTAANRNVASGDWSFVGGGIKNTASGTYGAVVGGFQNTVNSSYGGVVGGTLNTASGYAFVGGGYSNQANSTVSSITGGGFGATRSINGYAVFPACNNPIGTGAQGVQQAALLVLARQTTDATATVLCSDSSAASGTNQVILPNNSAYYFKGEVISGVTGGGNTKGWEISGVIKRGAGVGTTTLVGSTVTSMYADAGAVTWTIALSADTTNGGLAVTFTGQAGTTIRTVAQIRTTEMTF
jgi:hypothetical protein